jgi:hypothetical protein
MLKAKKRWLFIIKVDFLPVSYGFPLILKTELKKKDLRIIIYMPRRINDYGAEEDR